MRDRVNQREFKLILKKLAANGWYSLLLNWRCWDEKFFNNWTGFKFAYGMRAS
jgi:hypothetical protein